MAEVTIAELLGAFATGQGPRAVPEELRTLLLRHLADTIACAAAAGPELADSGLDPRTLLPPADPEMAATTIGGMRVSARSAALVGGTLSRYLDANDTYLPQHVRTVGHLSDASLAIVAMAESVHASGAELVDALVVSYECQGWLAEHFAWPEAGYHPTGLAAVGAALAAARLLGLDATGAANATALVASTGLILNTWLRPEGGVIPTVKGLAAGLGSERGLLCAELAASGGAAPADAFEHVWARAGATLRRHSDECPGDPWTIGRNAMKSVPSQIYTQSVAEAAGLLYERGLRLEEVSRIVVRSHRHASGHVQGSPRAFAPSTRGDADHSTPFVTVMMLRDGEITPRTYLEEPWKEPGIVDALRRVELVIDETMDREFDELGRYSATVVVTDSSGDEHRADIEQFSGHPERPLSQARLLRKLTAFTDDPTVWGPGAAAALLKACAGLPLAVDLSALTSVIGRRLGADRAN